MATPEGEQSAIRAGADCLLTLGIIAMLTPVATSDAILRPAVTNAAEFALCAGLIGYLGTAIGGWWQRDAQ